MLVELTVRLAPMLLPLIINALLTFLKFTIRQTLQLDARKVNFFLPLCISLCYPSSDNSRQEESHKNVG